MGEVSFEVSSEDHNLIIQITERAEALHQQHSAPFDSLSFEMDITACHANGTRLNLQKFLEFDDFSFAHDALGIKTHINRETGKLDGHFLPRCASHESE